MSPQVTCRFPRLPGAKLLILRRVWGRGWVTWTAAGSEALAEFFALLGRHLLPALDHPAAPVAVAAVTSAAATEAAEQDLAQDQNSHRLPEGDHTQAEKRRHQPVPEAHDHVAGQRQEQHGCGNGEEGELHHSSDFVSSHFLAHHRATSFPDIKWPE